MSRMTSNLGLRLRCTIPDDDEKEWSDEEIDPLLSTPLDQMTALSRKRRYSSNSARVRSLPPIEAAADGPVSILRSSSWCPSFGAVDARKSVSIVSPVKWHCVNEESMARKRAFIESQFSHRELQRVLLDLGQSAGGTSTECIDRLLAVSSWTPPQEYIERDERSRAKPIENDEVRIVELESGDLRHLMTVPTEDLKGWLRQNHIAVDADAKRRALEQTVSVLFNITTPIHNTVSSRLCPKTAKPRKFELKFKTPAPATTATVAVEERGNENEDQGRGTEPTEAASGMDDDGNDLVVDFEGLIEGVDVEGPGSETEMDWDILEMDERLLALDCVQSPVLWDDMKKQLDFV